MIQKPINFYSLILLFSVFFLSSCGRPAFVTHSDIDRTVDFSQYETFTMAELPPLPEDDVMDNNIIRKRIREYVAEELRAKGYQEVESGGDLLVRVNKKIQERREEETRYQPTGMGYMGGWWGGPWGWGVPMRGWGWGHPMWMNQMPYTHVREFVEGQVIVNVYDNTRNDLVWQGWSRGEVNRYRRTMRDRDDAVRRKVSEIMSDFPQAHPDQGPQAPTAQQ